MHSLAAMTPEHSSQVEIDELVKLTSTICMTPILRRAILRPTAD